MLWGTKLLPPGDHFQKWKLVGYSWPQWLIPKLTHDSSWIIREKNKQTGLLRKYQEKALPFPAGRIQAHVILPKLWKDLHGSKANTEKKKKRNWETKTEQHCVLKIHNPLDLAVPEVRPEALLLHELIFFLFSLRYIGLISITCN